MHDVLWDNLEIVDTLSNNSYTILVQDKCTHTKYIKKYISHLVLDVYKRLQKIDNIHIPKILLIEEYADIDNDNYSMVIEEYIEGKNIDILLKEKGFFSQREVLEYTIQICDGLQQIHSNNIVHRDIKPSNIILGNDGIIRIIDYGIARIIKENSQKDTLLFATPEYAPPEQFGSEQTNATADIHNLGITINEMLTNKHVSEELIKTQFKYIIIKCIDKDPKRRYLNALKLSEDLHRIKNKTFFFYINKSKIINSAIIAMLIIGFIVYYFFIKTPFVVEQVIDSSTNPTAEPITEFATESTTEPVTILVPELVSPTINYVVNQSEKNNKGEFYTNEKGNLLFGRISEDMLYNYGVGFPDVYYINNTVPESRILFTLENTGSQDMENISVLFEFSGLMLWGDENCWNTLGEGYELVFSNHVNGLGGYCTMKLDLGINLRPGEKSDLFSIDMSECAMLEENNAFVTITATADNCPPGSYTIPVGFSE